MPSCTPPRFVATSMELFDATPGREFSVLDYLFNPNATKPVSSFTPTPLEVLSQSFFSRLAPTAATATRTEQGITSKQLLISTNTDQVRVRLGCPGVRSRGGALASALRAARRAAGVRSGGVACLCASTFRVRIDHDNRDAWLHAVYEL